MEEQLLRELETAAQILLAAPNLVSNEQRHGAEAIFINFQGTKTPYVMCKNFLERSRIDYVLFESAGLIKSALIKEWPFLQQNDRLGLRDYLFNYVVERPTMAPFVRERILQVIAIMVKREGVDDMGASRTQLMNQVENMIMTGDHARQILGCNLMAALMQEFGVTFKSADVGLPWEEHYRAKNMFEVTDLKRIFQFCCRALSSITNSDTPLNQQGTALLKSLLSLSESVLTWKFVVSKYHRRIMIVGEIEVQPSLRLSGEWRDVILPPQLVDMFFTIYWKIRVNPQLAHHGMTCLIQLASLNGSIFDSKDAKHQYIINYLQNFIRLVTSVTVLDREASGISSIILKVLLYFPPSILAILPAELMNSFLEQFTKLTCEFAEGAANEESLCVEDQLYMEGFDHVMEAWLIIFMSTDNVSMEVQCAIAKRIIQTYVRLHLAPPEGARGGGKEVDAEELNESDEPDRLRFRSQLQTIGVMGRVVPSYVFPLLSQLLEDRTRRLTSLLEKLHNAPVTISDNNVLILLFEDIHWLLLISGYIISMYSEGETSTVPDGLMSCSIKQAADVNTSLQVFGSPDQDIKALAPNAEELTDHILRNTAAVFRLSYVLKKSMEAKLVQHLSPEVSSSVLWFLHRWSVTYLLLDEELYTDLSPVLLKAHGSDSQGGIWASRFLFDQVHAHLVHFNSEPVVVQDAVQLLLSLVQSRDKRNALIMSDALTSLIDLLPQLPTFVKRGVYKTLAFAGLSVVEGNHDPNFWVKVVEPLQTRFKSLACRKAAENAVEDQAIKSDILDLLECLIGISSGARADTVQHIFGYLGPIFSELPAILDAFHNYQAVVESVLTLLGEVARYLVPYLTRSEVRRFYEVCLRSIQTYAKWNAGRLSLESDAQDDAFEDVTLLLDLLINICAKDCFDLAPAEPEDENEQLISACDVCLNVLNLIMPLMTLELLKYPALCQKYYKLLAYVAEIFPEKILQLPDSLLKPILSSIELGLSSFGHDIVGHCCDFLLLLGRHLANLQAHGEPSNPVLRPYLKLLFNLVLSHQINLEHAQNTSSAILSLICCYQDEYNSLVQDLLSSQSDPAIRQRLTTAFQELTNGVQFEQNLKHKFRFRNNFEKFVVEVYSFLYVK